MTIESSNQSPGVRQTKRFSGVVVPLITPVTADGRGDEAGLLKIVDRIAEAGTELFVFGTTGESSSIPNEEKARLTAIICDSYAGKMDLYAGIASNCFEDSVELAKRFADMGVTVAVANLPSYYALDDTQILRYFEALADAIPLPLIIYNIPATTKMSIPLDIVDQLSEHDNIVGLKDSERDEDRLENAILRYKDRADFSHFIGWAAQSKKALLWGSDGLVPSSGNLVPGMYRELYDLSLKRDGVAAQRLQDLTDDISLIYQKDRGLGSALAALKVLMNELGLCEKEMWPPLVAIEGEEEAELRVRIAKALGI
jgi:dihydrodipicolinate synthase/N-acetylneuraminate lyase